MMMPKDGILILDAEHAVIEDVDPFITELLGCTREELLGRSFQDLGFLGDSAKSAALLEKVRRDGYVRCGRLPLRTLDDGRIFVEFVGNSYLVDERKVIQLNIRDASEKSPEDEAQARGGAEFDSLHEPRPGHADQIETSSLLQTITEHARVLTRADTAELFLVRPERNALERAHVAGAGVCAAVGDVHRGEGLECRVWQTGECVLLDKRVCPFRRALGAPIRWRGELLGVLGSLSSREGMFSESDAGMLDVLAGQAAVTIVNSRHSAEIDRLAVVDELTGVFNRRGLVILGAREVERARRLGRPLTALFVDLDHLQSLNDEFSYEVGDQALREVGRRIHDCIRGIDTVARYDGEEFVVLLVETDLGTAVEVAERIRQAVEATTVAIGRGAAHLTVSVGVTAYGPTTPDLDALIRHAEEAMVAAKEAGRNRVVQLAS